MPKVAVIIPVFNRSNLVKRAIASVERQTFGDFECILVDDCSAEPIALEGNDSRFRCIRLEAHSGVSRARNIGTSASTAPLIAFLDSDDEWLPRKLERQLHYLAEQPSYAILQCNEMWIRNGVRVNPPATHRKRAGDIFAESLLRCMITPSSVLMQRSLYDEFGGFNESMPACEDYDLWLKITAQHHVGLVNDILLTRYGGHRDQLSSSVPILDRFRVRSMLQLLLHYPLSENQRILLQQQICSKATILANGFKKRGNHEFSKKYGAIATTYGKQATGT